MARSIVLVCVISKWILNEAWRHHQNHSLRLLTLMSHWLIAQRTRSSWRGTCAASGAPPCEGANPWPDYWLKTCFSWLRVIISYFQNWNQKYWLWTFTPWRFTPWAFTPKRFPLKVHLDVHSLGVHPMEVHPLIVRPGGSPPGGSPHGGSPPGGSSGGTPGGCRLCQAVENHHGAY